MAHVQHARESGLTSRSGGPPEGVGDGRSPEPTQAETVKTIEHSPGALMVLTQVAQFGSPDLRTCQRPELGANSKIAPLLVRKQGSRGGEGPAA